MEFLFSWVVMHAGGPGISLFQLQESRKRMRKMVSYPFFSSTRKISGMPIPDLSTPLRLLVDPVMYGKVQSSLWFSLIIFHESLEKTGSLSPDPMSFPVGLMKRRNR